MTSTKKIVFRSEQQQAIDQTVSSLKRNRQMLWNAKMRFGKTLCALEVARRCGYRRTLILTHRPAVRSEWFSSIEKLGISEWLFGCKNTRAAGVKAESFEALEEKAQADKSVHYIYFASMQDLRGSKRVNQQKGIDKNDNIFAAHWDFLIVDEAHEGIMSRLGHDVIDELQKRRTLRTLYLSGTPYNIQQLFGNAEVYHWDYCMEQRAKNAWPVNHPNEPNPYDGLARMNIITYNLARELRHYRTAETGGFNFAELFRTETAGNVADEKRISSPQVPRNSARARFVHEDDVRNFIKLIGKNSSNKLYPYSNTKLDGSLDHTLWYVPGVQAAHCLASLLTEDSSDNPFAGYTVVDVAGDAADERLDIYEQTRRERDALERVKKAVSNNPKTITLSCGRLTMGVSVPEWTAVLMLAGAAETGGMRYFQTIFRCQSPYTDGRVKKECYAIDFTPRRTLTVVDQYVNNNTYTSQTEERHAKLAEFLELCPITEISAQKQTLFDTELFIRNVTSAYSDSLIKNGFRDDCLYGNLDNLRQQDLRLLDQVAEAIVRGIASERQRNRELVAGVTQRKRMPSKETANEKAAREKQENNTEAAVTAMREASRRMTPRQRAIAILNQISSRFPIMIYGTVERIDGLTLDSFVKSIDPDSWREFMPKGVTLKLFQRLKHFYREDIFVATAKAIVERLHRADELPVSERCCEIADILADFCYPDRETVLTPWRTINRHMADTIGGYCFYDERFGHRLSEPRFVYNGDVTERILMNTKARILDIASKTGLYSLYTAYSIYKLRSKQSQGLFDMLSDAEAEALWKDIIENNIFAVCRTHIAESITRRTLLGYRAGIRVNVKRIDDLTSLVMVYKRKFMRTVSNGKDFWKVNNNEQMKFDAIIGNPPYQVNIGEQKDNYGIPLYNQFVEIAREMQPNYISMIMPSRWFTGGRGLDNFRRTMLSDRRMRSIHDYVDSKDLFPTVDISGGVNYFLWDAHHKKECQFTNTLHGDSNTCERNLNQFPIFVRNNEALSFINKVLDKCKGTLNTQVSGQTPFGFVSTYRGTADPAVDTTAVELKSSGATSYVSRDDIKKNAQWTDLYKVVFSKATCEHAGTPDRNGKFRVLSSVMILEPAVVCTQSYLVGGTFATEAEAANFMAYLSTKFARYLLLQTITSQDLSPEKFMFVPIEDYTSASDIDWTIADIANIDRQLYAKYGITHEEAAIAEHTIKAM